jgi:hypothetical protein
MLGESNLNFDGSTLAVTGGATISTTLVMTGNITGANAAGPAFVNEAATDTNPTLIPNRAELDTGIGWAGADALTLVTGGAERMRINSTGAVTKPLNPFVSVFNGTQDDNVTGGGTAATISFDTELFDIGANFASDTTFTSPVDGKYLVTYRITALYVTTAMDVDLNLITTNRTYRHYSGTHSNQTWQVFDGTMLVEMAADDTLTLRLTCSGASDTVDIFGRSDLSQTFMMIQLIQ